MIQSFSETIKNEAKEQKVRFLTLLLGALGPSLLVYLLRIKVVIRDSKRETRAGQDF